MLLGDCFNQMPLAWLEARLPGADPAADTDGDGYANWEEYLLGTDPADPSDALRFTRLIPRKDALPDLDWAPAAPAAPTPSKAPPPPPAPGPPPPPPPASSASPSTCCAGGLAGSAGRSAG